MIIQAIHAYIYTNTHLLIHTMQKTKGESTIVFLSVLGLEYAFQIIPICVIVLVATVK